MRVSQLSGLPFLQRNLLQRGLWLLIAVGVGVCATVVPMPLLLIGAGVFGLLLIGLAQPIALLIATMIAAPLKVLIDTETHVAFDPGQWLLALTVTAWIVRWIAMRRAMSADPIQTQPLIYRSAIYLPIVIVLLGAGLSVFVALSPLTTLVELSKWLEMLIVATLVVSFCVTHDWQWPLIGLITAGVSQALIGLYEFFGGSGIPSLWILDNQRFRAFGTFGQPNPFGAFMGLLLPIVIGWLGGSIGLMFRRKAGLATIAVLILCAGLLFGGLIASWSRGGWLGFGAALFVMAIFAPRQRWRGLLFAAIVLLIGGGALVTNLVPASIASRLGDFTSEFTGIADVRGQVITDANYAVLERLAHWQAGLAMADAHPWLGVGFGNYEVAYPQVQLVNWKYPLGHAHNYYINMLAETGIVGLIAYVAAWLIIFALTIRLLSRTEDAARGVVLGLLGSWTYLSIHSLFDKLYVNNLFLHIGAMLGLIGGLYWSNRTENVGSKRHLV